MLIAFRLTASLAVCWLLPLSMLCAQNQQVYQRQSASGDKSSGLSVSQESRSWIVRDPVSGRLFQQEVVEVQQPVTKWQAKPVPTTVYEPRQVVKELPIQRTVYTPTTQLVMQPRLRGWWNPVRQPVQAYEFVPVTSWNPQTQVVKQQVAAVEWTARQQVVYVQQPVQGMQAQQQLVTRELPQPISGGPANWPMYASAQPKPLMTIPLLAQQRLRGWPSAQAGEGFRGVGDPGLRPISSLASQANSSIASSLPGNYYAPLHTASSTTVRDSTQTGMTATVLR